MSKTKFQLTLLLCVILLMFIPLYAWADVESNTDTDNDGLPDAWELKYANGDLTVLDKDTDYDEDGISNGVEYQLGTDPTIANPNGPRITYTYDKLGRIVKIERIPSQ